MLTTCRFNHGYTQLLGEKDASQWEGELRNNHNHNDHNQNNATAAASNTQRLANGSPGHASGGGMGGRIG